MKRKQKRYKLMTINGKELLDRAQVVQDKETRNWRYSFSYDFAAHEYEKMELISSIEPVFDCPLFYQITEVLKLQSSCNSVANKSEVDDSLLHHLIYVDFKSVFSSYKPEVLNKLTENPDEDYKSLSKESLNSPDHSYDRKLKWLFDPSTTVSLTFGVDNEKTETICFVPFDKSASMARESRITFIDKRLYEDVNKRLLLGMDKLFEQLTVNLSKYYAYRGLYLSTSERIEQQKQGFFLNQDTVIVIKDKMGHISIGNAGSLEAEESGPDPYWDIQQKYPQDISCNLFDGEGIISPEYALLINRQINDNLIKMKDACFEQQKDALLRRFGKCNISKNETPCKTESTFDIPLATSLQIRLPFGKGVLHAVDFHSFAKEVLGTDEIIIKDAYDIPRDLNKAHIVLTVSMLKCFQWLKTLAERSGEKDPMKFYFDSVKNNGHALYIANTSASYGNSNRTKTNYQFLNTLALTKKDFTSLCENHIKKIVDLRDTPQKQLQYLLCRDDDGDDMRGEQTASESLLNLRPELYAISVNEGFLSDPIIQSTIKNAVYSLELDLAKGRLDVEGECRIFSRDLLPLLYWICEQKNKDGSSKGASFNKNEEPLRKNRFYLPMPNIKLEEKKYYSFLRNPHLSRNEHCLLRPYIPETKTIFYKYLNHLKGIVMVSEESLSPMILGGADFDGDTVKVFGEETIVSAVKKSVYKGCENGGMERQLPVIIIPEPEDNIYKSPGNGYEYKVLKDTFCNRIGEVSNMAIRFGKREYADPANVALLNKNACAKCTLITGLEIDAAKNGKHPTKNIKELKQLQKDNDIDKDYFLKTVDKLDKLATDKDYEIEGDNTSGFKISYPYKKSYIDTIPPDSAHITGNIDLLPHFFASCRKDFQNNGGQLQRTIDAANPTLFVFQSNALWNEQLYQGKNEEVRKLMAAYKSIQTIFRELAIIKKESQTLKYHASVKHIIKIQYDDYSIIKPGAEKSILDILDELYLHLSHGYKKRKDAMEALDRLLKNRWHFTEKMQRESMLKKILGNVTETETLSQEEICLLSNFNNGGYRLLYYILKDIITKKVDTISSDDIIDSRKMKENVYFQDLYADVKYSISNKESMSVFEPTLIKKVQEQLNKLFKDDMSMALQYVVNNINDRKINDGINSFLWKVIDSETIKGNIYILPDKQGVGQRDGLSQGLFENAPELISQIEEN